MMFPSEYDKEYFLRVLQKYANGDASVEEEQFVLKYYEILSHRPEAGNPADRKKIGREIFDELMREIKKDK